MVWTKEELGPGPERLTNDWFNSLQGQIESNRRVARTFASGVVWGCEPTFQNAADVPGDHPVLRIAQGAVLVGGIYYEVPGKDLEITDETAPPDPGDFVWAFVRFDPEIEDELVPELAWDHGLSFTWPKTDDGHDLPVLALGQLDTVEAWEAGSERDLRHFVREKPNGAVLVVGDLDAGADFDKLQPALDYLGACDEGGNDVPRRILVTAPLETDTPYQVRCNGVVIEGVLNEVGPPPAIDGEDPMDERIIITWTNASTGDDPASGAAIDINGYKGVAIRNLHFIHKDNETWCCIHRPGDGFVLEGCIFGEDPDEVDETDPDAVIPESKTAVAVSFAAGTTSYVSMERNRAYLLRRGLIGFTVTDGGEGFTSGCLADSTIARNHVTTTGLVIPTAEDGNPIPCWWIIGRPLPEPENWSWKDPKKYFYAIDVGVHEEDCRNNVIRDNIIDNCFNGIRVGRSSEVSANVITKCIHFGVMVTATGTVSPEPMADDEYTVGTTEVSGNVISMSRFQGVPWWRAGVRLEVSACVVSHNTVIVGQSKGCGIVHGPLVMSEEKSVRAHFGRMLLGNHAVTGNNVIMNPITPAGAIDSRLALTRGGAGVLLLSVNNRVTDNGVFHARTGILVTAHNVVANNVITPSVVAILAWADNTVTGNSIGWFPHTAPGLPWELSIEAATGGIMLSIGNTCDGNVITAGTDNPDEPDAPTAVNVADWGSALFGRGWGSYFDQTLWNGTEDPRAARLVGVRSGGNTIANHVIDLSNPGGAAGDASAYLNLDGIVLNGDPDGNTVTETIVVRGRQGIAARTGAAVLTGCSTYLTRDLCLLLDDAPSSDVSGSVFYTDTGKPVRIGEGSTDTAVNDCLVVQASEAGYQKLELKAAHQTKQEVRELKLIGLRSVRPVAIEQRADRVSVNDCAIVNYSNAGIHWSGSFGSSGGCWFFTRDPGHENVPEILGGLIRDQKIYEYPRYPAIRFAVRPFTVRVETIVEDQPDGYYPAAATQGNLVFGAHMLNCAFLSSSSAAPGEKIQRAIDRDSSPIEWSNDFWMYDVAEDAESPFTLMNPDPPVYNATLQRWTNRVCVESCYYWDVHRYMPVDDSE